MKYTEQVNYICWLTSQDHLCSDSRFISFHLGSTNSHITPLLSSQLSPFPSYKYTNNHQWLTTKIYPQHSQNTVRKKYKIP